MTAPNFKRLCRIKPKGFMICLVSPYDAIARKKSLNCLSNKATISSGFSWGGVLGQSGVKSYAIVPRIGLSVGGEVEIEGRSYFQACVLGLNVERPKTSVMGDLCDIIGPLSV